MIVGVVGAGAMGAGIAQVAAAAGHKVVISDSKAGASSKAREAMTASLAKLVEKGKLGAQERDALIGRISFVDALLARDLSIYKECGLVIEAVVEDLAVKRTLFATLGGVVGPNAILATNTSSLAVASIASAPVN